MVELEYNYNQYGPTNQSAHEVQESRSRRIGLALLIASSQYAPADRVRTPMAETEHDVLIRMR